MELITSEEKAIARFCVNYAIAQGAEDTRVTLIKEITNQIATLDGDLDRVSSCYDRSLYIMIKVNGRHGSFCTNDLKESTLKKFISDAVASVQMLSEDQFYVLPSRDRICTDALKGDEMQVQDISIADITHEQRLNIVLAAALKNTGAKAKGCTVVSEECEYSDIWSGVYKIDNQGLEALHYDTSFEYSSEVTVQDKEGDRYSGFWWTSAPFLKDFDCSRIGEKALLLAQEQIDPIEVESFKGKMVVDTECAAKLVTPIIDAIQGQDIQQHNSFLEGKLGHKVFSEGFTLIDTPREAGHFGSKIFDREGVARFNSDIFVNGVLKEYSINTYIGGKMNMEPTRDDVTAPKLMPWPKQGLGRNEILELCGSGILVTGFNGGNNDSATGNFSYGIEGFAFENGRITHPIHEMLVTGDFITLWNNLIAVGDDARPCMEKRIPTLAFDKVDFNG